MQTTQEAWHTLGWELRMLAHRTVGFKDPAAVGVAHHASHLTGYKKGERMHHKRHRPKNRRAGCLMCKPWKGNGMSRVEPRRRAVRADTDAAQQMGTHHAPRPKPSRRKRYTIQYRCLRGWMPHGWRVWGRYGTPQARRQALATLTKPSHWTQRYEHSTYEFRLGR